MKHRKAAIAGIILFFGVFFAINWLAFGRAGSLATGQAAAAFADTSNDAQHLPVVMAPQNTPTPLPTNTPEPTATPLPTLTPTVTPTASPTSQPPTGGNVLVNGSFEDGWTDLPPAPGFLINQQPAGWELKWLQPGEPIWDDSSTVADGVPECLHKLASQLPPPEQPGGSQALILDGVATYKMFHFGAPFGSQLYQVVNNLPPGSRWRLTVPVQAHLRGDNDPWAAESGVWVITSQEQAGGWVPGGNMGDRQWFYHTAEITAPADGRIEILIRVKSKWPRGKDFFIDHVRLEPVGNRTAALIPGDSLMPANGRHWQARPLDELPTRDIVTP